MNDLACPLSFSNPQCLFPVTLWKLSACVGLPDVLPLRPLSAPRTAAPAPASPTKGSLSVCLSVCLSLFPPPPPVSLSRLEDAEEVFDFQLPILDKVRAVHGVHHLVQPVLAADGLRAQDTRKLRVVWPNDLSHGLHGVL
jgi:hypothetical protein